MSDEAFPIIARRVEVDFGDLVYSEDSGAESATKQHVVPKNWFVKVTLCLSCYGVWSHHSFYVCVVILISFLSLTGNLSFVCFHCYKV